MFTRPHLHQALAQLGVQHPGDIFEKLAIAYSEPWRHYHTQEHIRDCLTKFADYRTQLSTSLFFTPETTVEIEIALYFHDAVYYPDRQDNEARSAQWARDYLASHQVCMDSVERICQLVLATKTHRAQSSEAEVLLDIDLSILGAPEKIFDRYDSAIRREYHWIPAQDYVRARCEILEHFLSRQTIYQTACFQQRWEAPARQNLTNLLSRLKTS